MTAAIPQSTTGHHQWIPLAKLKPSPLNHRKHFDPEKMKELEDSVRVQGVIVPIIARPLGEDGFEVVAGERRYRAARAVELPTVPAIVRELTDAEALELQVTENQQRVDVHPLEEAEGYEALMQCQRADGSSYTVDEIAAKVGKSRGYVYARLKLLALCPEGRQALLENKINASAALLVARIPVPKLQAKAVKEIVEPGYNGEPMSYREAKEHIERLYMLRLKEAPFKPGDAGLVPAAGACTACPKRTGNQPELFADIAGADVCTDPQCFETKTKAYGERRREEAIAAGATVISGKEAKKLLPYEHSRPNGYVKLDDCCWDDPKQRTYRALLGKAAATPALIEKHWAPGEFAEVLAEDVVTAALEKKGYHWAKEEGSGARITPLVKQRDREESVREHEVRRRLWLAWREAVARDGLGSDDLRAMLSVLIDFANPDEETLKLWGCTQEQLDGGVDLADVIAKAEAAQLVPMLLDLTFPSRAYDEDPWAELAKARGIDRKAIEREVKAEFKAKAKADANAR